MTTRARQSRALDTRHVTVVVVFNVTEHVHIVLYLMQG